MQTNVCCSEPVSRQAVVNIRAVRKSEGSCGIRQGAHFRRGYIRLYQNKKQLS